MTEHARRAGESGREGRGVSRSLCKLGNGEQSDSQLPSKSSCVFFFGHCESFPFIVVSFQLKKKKSKVISPCAVCVGATETPGSRLSFLQKNRMSLSFVLLL